MKLRSIASPLTIAAFISVAVTGLLMFFGYHGSLIRLVHEWASLIFVVGAVLHIACNWKPMLAYCKRPVGAVLLVIFLVATLVAIFPNGEFGWGNRSRRNHDEQAVRQSNGNRNSIQNRSFHVESNPRQHARKRQRRAGGRNRR